MVEKVTLEFVICNSNLFKGCIDCGALNKAQEEKCFLCGSDKLEEVSFETILGLISAEESQKQVEVSE
jgi:RNA polymerase subunit RPABC4/transcription elongation factor Spt4